MNGQPYLTGRSKSPLLMAAGRTLGQFTENAAAQKRAEAEQQRLYALETLKAKYAANQFQQERAYNAIDNQAEYGRQLERDRLQNEQGMERDAAKEAALQKQGLVAPRPTNVQIGDQQAYGTFNDEGVFVPAVDNQGRPLIGPKWSPGDAGRNVNNLYQESLKQAGNILKDDFAREDIATQLGMPPDAPLTQVQPALAKLLTEQNLENLQSFQPQTGGNTGAGKSTTSKPTKSDIQQAASVLRQNPQMVDVVVQRLREAGATDAQIREATKVIR